ncbi:MAG: hypothetical protein DKM50_06020 [Candidatus Margulisiibacteriota bacterium]|nr:MAG: hypothetical protein A2X43_10335 [Candidatus Margulisbacteria bacterium GWD2_39_127]OGI05423.1 MAG: hypothetical protein A2X42_09175 [Candidatus Margulisbacteria bacterium GWF2_38_17]OGI07839.1 MAG: hypothetical protein A2X41_11980 [Candidatus Margulisbacteria bacterium GWE2_39_32]PZM80105.1 MAG: hypothetical protein DKM50_06020 [Candidatus Margulisiibacteriota bacterium]HAR62631.1 hypothetical protein [Candidatus Margulisiibacteriota bacterium]
MNEVITMTPNTSKDLFVLANKVKRGIPVYLDLRRMSDNQKERILDFFAGINCGLGGYMKEIRTDFYYINKKLFSLDLFLMSFQRMFR